VIPPLVSFSRWNQTIRLPNPTYLPPCHESSRDFRTYFLDYLLLACCRPSSLPPLVQQEALVLGGHQTHVAHSILLLLAVPVPPLYVQTESVLFRVCLFRSDHVCLLLGRVRGAQGLPPAVARFCSSFSREDKSYPPITPASGSLVPRCSKTLLCFKNPDPQAA